MARSSCVSTLTLLLAVELFAARAGAQQLPAADAAVVTAPRVVSDPGAAYPSQALRDRVRAPVTVALVVVVGADGHVESVTVSEARGHGFDEAAVAAAEKVTFLPATRDGKAIAARITFRYSFTPPADAAVPVHDAAHTDHAATTPGGEDDVTVKADRPPREVTRRTLGREEVAHSPGTHGDALLSLQNLPGVARPPPFSGALIVRGSAPQDTNIFIDGTNVPLAYHFGGLTSVIPTELLEKVDFFPGNYSARYGRGMGGVVDVGLRDPKKDGYHGLAQVDFLGGRALVEGPIARGWSFLVAAQRSWLDLLLNPVLTASGSGATILPSYYDYQAEARKNVGEHASFRVAFLGSNDALDLVNPTPGASDPTSGGALAYHTSFWRLQARFDDKPSDGTRLRLLAAYGEDSERISVGTNLSSTVLRPLSGRAELSQRLSPRVVANVGLDMVYEPYDSTLQMPPATRPGAPSGGPGELAIRSATSGTLFLPGAYTELEVVPWAGARVVPGIRADYDSATKGWDVAPRINVRQDLTSGFPRTTLKAGFGVYDQPPTPLDTDPRLGQYGLVSNRSKQTDVGVEQELTRHLDLSLDVFYKSMDRLVVSGAGNAGEGFAYGAEWLVRYKPDEHFFGWLSYTLSRSERRDVPSEPLTLFQYDQTHVLTALGSYKLGRGWQIGARFRLTSGDLHTPTSTGAYDATVGSQLGVSAFPPYGSRFPLFEQLDIRMDKVWTARHFTIDMYLDLQNVYNASNPLAVTYNYNFTKSAVVSGLPILPIAGVRADF